MWQWSKIREHDAHKSLIIVVFFDTTYFYEVCAG